jgi:hypothetical protein
LAVKSEIKFSFVIDARYAHIIFVMKHIKIISVIALVAALSGLSMYAFFSSPAEKKEENALVIRERKVKRGAQSKRAVRGRKTSRISVKNVAADKVKPSFDIDDEEEKKLTSEQRELLVAIRKALDDDDQKMVLKFVHKLQKSPEWPDGIPKSIKMAAIDALGWFGSSCLPEIAGFLADADGEIIQSAVEKYEEALGDFDLSDRERSVILVEASKVITDSDAMDMMLFELNNMRHSVAVETIKQLLEVAGEATKAVLPDNIEFYTGEEGMNTPEKLDEWLKENPDDPDDEEFFGAQK